MTDGPRLPDARMIPGLTRQTWVSSQPSRAADEDTDESFIRPFIVTGGRTRPQPGACALRVDTLVRALPEAASAPLEFERLRIAQLCRKQVQSVAEVAAVIGVPLGVARVLIADLIAENLLFCQEATELSGHAIERIRDLVRAL